MFSNPRVELSTFVYRCFKSSLLFCCSRLLRYLQVKYKYFFTYLKITVISELVFFLCGSCYINGSIRASIAHKLSLETLDTIRNEKNAYRYQIYGLAIFQDQSTYLLLRYHQSQCCLTSKLKMNVHPYK